MKKKLWIWMGAAGFCLMVLGIARGEVQTVLKKAILICLECIGIG